jgi:membrane protein YdbS with pleckstrin-like domain
MRLRPHGRALVLPAVVLVVAMGSGGFAAARVAAGDAQPLLRALVAAAVLLVVLRACVVPFLRWLTTTVTVTDRRVRTRTGVVRSRTRDVPLSRVCEVVVERSLLQRAAGSGTLLLHTTGEGGGLLVRDVPGVRQVAADLGELLADLDDAWDDAWDDRRAGRPAPAALTRSDAPGCSTHCPGDCPGSVRVPCLVARTRSDERLVHGHHLSVPYPERRRPAGGAGCRRRRLRHSSAAAAAETPPAGTPLTAVNQSSNDAPSGHPEIASAGEAVYQAWTDFGVDPREIGQILLKVSHDGGSSWPIARHVSLGLPYSEEPDVAAAGTDAWVTWQSTTPIDLEPSRGHREVYVQAMRNEGKRPEPYQNVSLDSQDSVDPQVAVAPGGWVLVTWHGLHGDVHLAWSDDGGREFRRMLVAPGALGGDIAVADGVAYIASSPKGSTGIDVTSVRLERPSPGAPIVKGATVRVADGRVGMPQVEAFGDTVHATWMDASGPRPVTMYARSLDRGATWQQPQQMTAPGAVGGYGDLQVDERGVWVSSTMFGRGTTVQHSADLGGSWAAPVELGGVNRGAHAVFSDPSGPARTTPSPTLDWTMPDRYGRDRNGDGMVDYDVSPEFLRPSSYAVDLDACGTTGGDSPVVTYAWTVNGSTTETGTCRTRREYPSEGTFPTKVRSTTAGRRLGVDPCWTSW